MPVVQIRPAFTPSKHTQAKSLAAGTAVHKHSCCSFSAVNTWRVVPCQCCYTLSQVGNQTFLGCTQLCIIP